MVVFKYVLQNRPGYQEIAMPKGAKVIHLAPELRKHPDVNGELSVEKVNMWAIVDQSELPHLQPIRDLGDPGRVMHTTRTFAIEMTGDDRPYIKPETYMGTYFDGSFVLHVFEVRRG